MIIKDAYIDASWFLNNANKYIKIRNVYFLAIKSEDYVKSSSERTQWSSFTKLYTMRIVINCDFMIVVSILKNKNKTYGLTNMYIIFF